MNESETLAKYILYEYKCKFDIRKWISDRNWNNDECRQRRTMKNMRESNLIQTIIYL